MGDLPGAERLISGYAHHALGFAISFMRSIDIIAPSNIAAAR
jgi:hypothetical protein